MCYMLLGSTDMICCDTQGALEDLDAALVSNPSNMLALRHRAASRLDAMDFQVRCAAHRPSAQHLVRPVIRWYVEQ